MTSCRLTYLLKIKKISMLQISINQETCPNCQCDMSFSCIAHRNSDRYLLQGLPSNPCKRYLFLQIMPSLPKIDFNVLCMLKSIFLSLSTSIRSINMCMAYSSGAALIDSSHVVIVSVVESFGGVTSFRATNSLLMPFIF